MIRPKPRLRAYFDEYEKYHRTSGNKVCHFIGIPLITVTLLGLLGMTGGLTLIAVATAWFAWLDWRLGLLFFPALLALWGIGMHLAPAPLWVGFVLGWVVQFVGHYAYEKKSPAFFNNLEHVLIGPMWIFARSIGVR